MGGRRSLHELADHLPTILRETGEAAGTPAAVTWEILSATWTITDVAVFAVGPRPGEVAAIVKVPDATEGAANLRRQRLVLDALRTDVRLASWVELLPVALVEGDVEGRCYFVERALPGVELRKLQGQGSGYIRGLASAASAASVLHRATAQRVVIGQTEIERWVDKPLAIVERLARLVPGDVGLQAIIDSTRSDLLAALAGEEMATAWIHGDLWPGNVLVAPDGSRVTGLVDWGRAAPGELPMHDTMHLVMHSPRLMKGRTDLGSVVRSQLRDPDLTREEINLLRTAELPFAADTAGLRRMILLYWLRHLSTYLAKYPTIVRNQWWVRRNVTSVFREVSA
jgi:hypothetical protein